METGTLGRASAFRRSIGRLVHITIKPMGSIVRKTNRQLRNSKKMPKIAIPINVAHNYFVTRVDRLVIDMEESAQKMIDALHEQEMSKAAS